MDPKSRDSQGCDLPLAGVSTRAFAAALVLAAAMFGAGCDVESSSTDEHLAANEAVSADVGSDRDEGAALGLDRGADAPQVRVSWSPVTRIAASAIAPATIDADRFGATKDDDGDDDGEASGDTCAATDVTAPVVTGRTIVLGADAHGMKAISPTDCADVVDDCDGDPLVELLWATSDEPESGVALDDRFPDVSDLGCGIGVRAERADGGDGRVYTIGFRAVDRAGNTTEGLCEVLVEAEVDASIVDSGAKYEIDVAGGYGCTG